jgi:pimeloyl-ACP methyl ester carboxylesterase
VPLHLVGHSVGGVIAAAYIHQHPDRVASFINVEGNFTLNDAFWSRQLAAETAEMVEQRIEASRSDPAQWLRDEGIEPTEERIVEAREALTYQPSSTVQATARAVVDFTGKPGYENLLRSVFRQHAVHLVAGARSRKDWDVPDWALEAAKSYSEIPGAGHMMMLEAPEEFGKALRHLLEMP